MKVPLSWLRELVELDAPLPELRQRLTMAGLEVEDVHHVGSDWQDVTIGRIKQIDCRAGDANIAAMAVRADVPRR